MNRVLIVDDEKDFLNITAEQIEDMGFVPLKASNAKEALKIWHEQAPHIVVTDLNLGDEMDGVALCSRILYEDRTAIVIAVSGYFSIYDKTYCLAAGFSDFLSKPIDPNDLLGALQCAFDRRQRWAAI